MRAVLGALALAGAAWAAAEEARDAAPLAPGAFRIAETGATADGGTRYVVHAGGRCSFAIEIGKGEPVSGSLFTITTGRLVRRRDADCSAFLRELGPKLGFKGKLPTPRPAATLEVAAAILGTKQTRSSADLGREGSFTSNPPGHWTVTKLFLADGESEVFLNLNSDEKVGELSLKDEDAADAVMSELAKILRPDGP